MGNREKLDDAMGIPPEEQWDEEELDEDNIDEYISGVRSSIKHLPENPNSEEDAEEIERYNKRKREIEEFKKKLETAKGMSNKDWAQQILKNSTHNMLVAQMIALGDIEEDPMSKKVTSLAEISNAITSSTKTMMDIDAQAEVLEQSNKKIRLREMEVHGKLNIVDSDVVRSGIGSGSTSDMLELLESEVEDG